MDRLQGRHEREAEFLYCLMVSAAIAMLLIGLVRQTRAAESELAAFDATFPDAVVELNTAPLVVLSPLRQVRLALVPNAGGAPTTVPMKDPEVPGSSAR